MKRMIRFLSALALVICLVGCNESTAQSEASKDTAAAQSTEVVQTTTAAQTTEAIQSTEAIQTTEAMQTTEAVQATEADSEQADVVILEDFTVTTIDGGSFTLSEALKDHELVLINIFATWCPPCGEEFPFMEEAYQQASDRVAIVALSIEKEDTDEVLKQYAEEKGITFPVGHLQDTDLRKFVPGSIPTTIIVDRTGRVAAVEVGSKESVQEFLDLFDNYTGSNYNPNQCTYTVCAYDIEDEGVAGVTVNFCTDSACTPVVTDEEGYAYFKGAPGRYHVQIIGTPDGTKVDGDSEMYTEPYSQIIWVPLIPEGEGKTE